MELMYSFIDPRGRETDFFYEADGKELEICLDNLMEEDEDDTPIDCLMEIYHDDILEHFYDKAKEDFLEGYEKEHHPNRYYGL